MAEFTKFVDATDGEAQEVNDNFNSLSKRLLGTYLNLQKLDVTSGYTLTKLHKAVHDLFDSDTATTKTNWTYDGTGDQYTNTQTAQATLVISDMLSGAQKNETPTIRAACVWFEFYDAGDEDTGIVANKGFETAGGGGLDVFGSWTEAADIVTGNTGTVVWTRSTTGETEGTYCAEVNGSITNQNSGVDPSYSTLTQTINVTGIRYVSVDYSLTMTQTAGAALAHGATISIDVGGVSASDSVAMTGGSDSTSGTFIIDVEALEGNQTITLRVVINDIGWGSRTYTWTGRFDNVRTIKGGAAASALTRVIYLSANGGSNWTTVNNGEWVEFANTGNNLCARIIETRSNGSALFSSKVVELAVFYEA
jgi:hypothetical protein